MHVNTQKDVSDALSTGVEHGGLLLDEADLAPSFFDLKSRFAGDMFQQFVKYRVPLALVVCDPSVYGDRFSELAREHRNHPMVRIFSAREEAAAWLATMR